MQKIIPCDQMYMQRLHYKGFCGCGVPHGQSYQEHGHMATRLSMGAIDLKVGPPYMAESYNAHLAYWVARVMGVLVIVKLASRFPFIMKWPV